MAMGTRKQRERQEPLRYRAELAEGPGRPFYRRLNRVLEQAGLDRHCEENSAGHAAARLVLSALLVVRMSFVLPYAGGEGRGLASLHRQGLQIVQDSRLALRQLCCDLVPKARERSSRGFLPLESGV